MSDLKLQCNECGKRLPELEKLNSEILSLSDSNKQLRNKISEVKYLFEDAAAKFKKSNDLNERLQINYDKLREYIIEQAGNIQKEYENHYKTRLREGQALALLEKAKGAIEHIITSAGYDDANEGCLSVIKIARECLEKLEGK